MPALITYFTKNLGLNTITAAGASLLALAAEKETLDLVELSNSPVAWVAASALLFRAALALHRVKKDKK
jgi:hypothetical protein